jgi:hypothetical protein
MITMRNGRVDKRVGTCCWDDKMKEDEKSVRIQNVTVI